MYLDPGFGGMLVQVIIVIAAVGGGLLFSFRRRLRNLFSKDRGNAQNVVATVVQDTPDDAVDVLEDNTTPVTVQSTPDDVNILGNSCVDMPHNCEK